MDKLEREFKKVSDKYVKTKRPITLKDACRESISKWNELINLALINKEIPYEKHIKSKSCGLCKFLNNKCKLCPLKRCVNGSLWDGARNTEDYDNFVYYAYRIIKKIENGYYKRTGDVL